LPFERKTWNLAAEKGEEIERAYWSGARPRPLPTDADEATFAIRMLIEHSSLPQAFLVLLMAFQEGIRIESSLIMETIETWMRVGSEALDPNSLVRFQIPRIVQELQKRAAQVQGDGVDPDRLARIELFYLELLNGYPVSPVTLYSKLQVDPEFFVEVVALAYPSTNQTAETDEAMPERKRMPDLNAYRLLMSWCDLPGARADGTIDERALWMWVRKARALAESRGLQEACDRRIGEVLAYAPNEDDRSWPSIPVRDALEEIDTDEVLDGFLVGILNKRGGVSKSMREGGAQERELAEKYRRFAEASAIEWPKTASLLRRIADHYEDDARREDERVALER
jgi:hypothetical protein